MTKIILSSLLAFVCVNTAIANIAWWDQITICRIDTTKCYTTMGAGFDPDIWDADAGCRGMKYICPEALIKNTIHPELIGKKQLTDKKIIKSDYNTDLLSETGDCFGRRTSNDTGSQVLVNGKYVNVYCHGVLSKSDEILDNGEIVYDTQPTCETLKQNEYIAAENGKCYGKYLDSSKYHIECSDDLNDLLPERIIVLNGADLIPATNNPISSKDADKLFKKMQSVSKKQKEQYFKK